MGPFAMVQLPRADLLPTTAGRGKEVACGQSCLDSAHLLQVSSCLPGYLLLRHCDLVYQLRADDLTLAMVQAGL